MNLDNILRWVNVAVMRNVPVTEILAFLDYWAGVFADAEDDYAFSIIGEYADAVAQQ